MPKQTRRCVSISGGLYNRLTDHCEVVGISRASVVEEVVNDCLNQLDDANVVIEVDRASYRKMIVEAEAIGIRVNELAETLIVDFLDEERRRLS